MNSQTFINVLKKIHYTLIFFFLFFNATVLYVILSDNKSDLNELEFSREWIKTRETFKYVESKWKMELLLVYFFLPFFSFPFFSFFTLGILTSISSSSSLSCKRNNYVGFHFNRYKLK